jgi:hypothetical protein
MAMDAALSDEARKAIEAQIPKGAKFLLFVVDREKSCIYTNMPNQHVLPYALAVVEEMRHAEAARRQGPSRN